MKRCKFLIFGTVCALFLTLATWVSAAPITAAPTRVTQPDGTRLDLYSSGDEFFNYIHDADGNLVMRRDDGWYVYAANDSGLPTPTGAVVGGNTEGRAALLGMDTMTAADIDFAAHPELTHTLDVAEPTGEEIRLGSAIPAAAGEDSAQLFAGDAPRQQMANLVIFIRFPGEDEFLTLDSEGLPIAPIPEEDWLEGFPHTINFGDSYRQVSRYMQTVSNGNFDVDTTFLTADESNTTILSCVAPHPRAFYESISGSSSMRFDAEMELLEYAIASVAQSIPAGTELDYDHDGYVDNITFIVSGATAGWNDLLWPHSWALQRNKILLPNKDGDWKQCFQFNFNFANPRYAGVGVLSHELLHAVGYPDLYRYDHSGEPVGEWDAMGSTDYADPQFIGAYLKDAYTTWGNLGHISASGTYTLWPLGTEGETEGYQIPTGVVGEYVCVEYRKNGAEGDVTQDNVPCDGLLVYRANRKTTQGNRNGTVNGGDEVYVFRSGDAAPNAGTKAGLKTAALNGTSRTALGAALSSAAAPETTLYLDNGENSGIVIDEVEVLPDGRISFRVTLPDNPTSITPGRYDVDGDDYFIDQRGSYTFYGATTRHHITVAAGTKDVSITFEAADMNLSALTRSCSPLTIRSGAEVTVTFAPSGEGETFTLLSGSVYMPGIKVEKGGKAALQGAGGELNASGGTGAPGVGSDAFSDGGFLYLKDLRAVFSGGAGFTLSGGDVILAVSRGSSALGGGFCQKMDGLTIENSALEVHGGNDIQAISTGYLDLSGGEYVPGGDLTIRNSSVTARGSVDAGQRLTVEDSDLTVTLGTDSLYNGALNAVSAITLTNSHTVVDVKGRASNIMNRNTRDTCVIEIRGGSAYLTSRLNGVAGKNMVVSADTDLVIAVEGDLPLAGPWDETGEASTGAIIPPVGETPGVFLRGSFAAATSYRATYSLQDGGVGRYVELPAQTKAFVVSLPQTGTYVLRDEDGASSEPLPAPLTAVNTVLDIALRAPSRLERKVDVSQGNVHLTENGTYVLSGEGTGQVTVAEGRNVTIYLDNVTIHAENGSALSVGKNTTAAIIAKQGTENVLTGAPGSPAIQGEAGSALAFQGTGFLAAHGGSGAAGIAGQGRVTIEQVTPLMVLSDQSAALTRAQSDSAAWSALSGAEPVVARLTLAKPLPAEDVLTLFSSAQSRTVSAQGGVESIFLTLAVPSAVTLERGDGARTPALPCEKGITHHADVKFESTAFQQGGVLDLSLKSYTVTKNGAYTVTGETRVNTLRIAPGVSAHLNFDNVKVTAFSPELPAILDLGAGSVVTINLQENTQNSLVVDAKNTYAGAIHVPFTARLTIEGEGALTAAGGASVATIGAGYGEEGGTIFLQGGDIELAAPAGSGNSRIALGGDGARVEISGGMIHQAMSYGAGLGGKAARVTIRGGEISWRTAGAMPVGGEQSVVTVQGGKLFLDLARGGVGLGGSGSRVTVQGGEIEFAEQENSAGASAAIGGRDSRLTLTGGSVMGTLQKPIYSGYGGLGGENAVASVGGNAAVFLRYRHKDARPLANADLFALGQEQAAFLDIRFREPLASAQTLTLTRQEDDQRVSVPLEQGDAGFFLRLEEGVWHLENAAGGYGGAYSLTPGVTEQAEVTFDRLRGVFLESRTVEYSGAAHTLTVSGLPAGASVRYSGNSQREPGTYPVTATITTSGGATYDLTAVLTITKARLTVTGIQADSKEYNGNNIATGKILYSGAKGSDRPQFSAVYRFENANAGSGKTVTASNVGLASSLWAGRYILNDIDPALLTARADITPKPMTLTFPKSSLTQMAGLVVPVTPVISSAGGLDPKNVTVTYTASGGAPTSEVPQAAGEYTVTIVLKDSNYCIAGADTAVLKVEAGFDLRQADAHITAPGDYTITSYNTPTHHRIIVDAAVTGQVTLYLSGVNIQANPGEHAVELSNPSKTVICVQGNTENILRGGDGNTAAISALHSSTRVTLELAGGLTLWAGQGGAVTARMGNPFSVTHQGGALRLLSSEADSAKDINTTTSWVDMTFAETPQEDVPFTMTVEGTEYDCVLPAGGQRMWWAIRSSNWDPITLRDRNGVRLRAGSRITGNLVWTDIPLLAEARQSYDLDIAKAPYTIDKSGVYRVYGVKEDTSFASQQTLITIEDGLDVELVLDNVVATFSDTAKPLISIGANVDLTVTARGQSALSSLASSVIWESCGSDTPTSTVTLRGEEGAFAELNAACYSTASSAANATIYAGYVTMESGTWSIKQYDVNRNQAVWAIRAPKGFVMSGGEAELNDAAVSKGTQSVGGIFSKGDVLISGGKLDIICYRTQRGYTDGSGDDRTAGIYVGGSKTFTIHGGRVSIHQEQGSDGMLLYLPDSGTVALRSGALYLSTGAMAGGSEGINCKNLEAVGGFELLGLDGQARQDGQTTFVNKLLVQNASGTTTLLPGPDDNVPVIYRGLFNEGKGLTPNEKKDITITFSDDEGVTRTLVIPKRNSVNKYLYFLVLLPKTGQYDVSYQDTRGNTLTTTIHVAGDGTGSMGEFTRAGEFENVGMEGASVLWDGAPKTLTVDYAVLPNETQVKYTYATKAGIVLDAPPAEPGEYAVTARLTAPGYKPLELTRDLIIQKRPLTLQIAVEDKPVYDGSTAAKGTLTVEGGLPGDIFTATGTFAFADANVGKDKTVTITNIAIAGPENWAAHYDLTVPATLTATASILEKAALTVVWTEPTLVQTYGAVGPVQVRAVQTDAKGQIVVSLTPTVAYNGEEAVPTRPGLYTVSALLNDPNYTAEATASLRIQPRGLTFTALPVPNAKVGDDVEKTVETDSGFTLADPGLVAGDAVGVRFTIHYDDLTEGTSKPVTVLDLTLTGEWADCYYVEAYPDKAAVTVTAGGGEEPDPGPEKPDPGPEKPDPTPDKPKPSPGGSSTTSRPATVPEASVPQGPAIRHTGRHPFVDLLGHWAEADGEWCWQRDLMTGMDATHFAPDIPMTRGMFVTILGRLEGIEVARWDIETAFRDVERGLWYAPYVAWAHSAGLVLGRDPYTFAPDDPITRQELAVLLKRYFDWSALPLKGQNAPNFADQDAVASWAAQAVEAVSRGGLLIGFPDGSFGPDLPLTRAQSATLLRRLVSVRYSEAK